MMAQKKPAFFNDEDDDEEDSFKPVNKALPVIGAQKAPPMMGQPGNKPPPTLPNTQSKFSKLFQDEDDDEDY